MKSAGILNRNTGCSELERRVKGGPANQRRRIVDALARCYVLETDRIVYDKAVVVSCRSIIPYIDPVDDPYSHWWPWVYAWQYPFGVAPVMAVRRKEVLQRIAKGKLSIDDKLGVWNGSFWCGLRLSGAIRKGPGTELNVWEKPRRELMADLSEMPLMHRLEPKPSKGGQRRLRRCYAAFLPAEDKTGRSVLAGLFAGAVLRNGGDGVWLELPDGEEVRAVLNEWGMPFLPFERPKGRRIVHISPLFALLVVHLMPPNSAIRIRAIKKAGGCPFLSVVLWEMAIGRKNRRYMPFPSALPFGCSKATFFRHRWRRRDLHKIGWLELGIRMPTGLRELLTEWFEQRTCERVDLIALRSVNTPQPSAN